MIKIVGGPNIGQIRAFRIYKNGLEKEIKDISKIDPKAIEQIRSLMNDLNRNAKENIRTAYIID